MALFKSQLLTQASGSVGGVTFTRTNSGMVIRGRSMPINPRSELQQVVRNSVGQLATRWVEVLTEEQRELWTAYAKNVLVKNKLGDSIALAGNAMYIRCNVPRLQAGLIVVDDAPTAFSTGDALSKPELYQDEATPFAVEFNWEATSTSPGRVLVYVSAPQNASKNFFKGPFRYNSKALLSAGSVNPVPNPQWVKGQRLFVRARVSYDDGRLSPETNVSYVLANTPAPVTP